MLDSNDLLAQATCAVIIDGKIRGTAWLFNLEGYLLTAGHLLETKEKLLDKVEVRFANAPPVEARRIEWCYSEQERLDFAILKIESDQALIKRHPLPISLARSVEGTFRVLGYGKTLVDLSTGWGQFVGIYNWKSSPDYRLFRLDSKELGEEGYSGGAVFSEQLQAVVAIQTSATRSSVTRAGRDTVLALPLYRIAARWDGLHRLASQASGIQEDIAPPNVDTEFFCGREKELKEFEQWLMVEGCRVVMIWGMGGVGKTYLARRLREQLESKFDYVLWEDLLNAPPVEKILHESITCFSGQQQIAFPNDLNDLIQLLLSCMQKHRCLLVLDNVESILKPHVRSGSYKDGYAGYSQLIQAIGTFKHQSCLLLTSREKTSELSRLKNSSKRVQILPLEGLDLASIKQFLLANNKELVGTEEDWSKLTIDYAGNPIILGIVASTIIDIYQGNIGEFLQDSNRLEDVRSFIYQQIDRLTDIEKQALYWLAIRREVMTLKDLKAAMAASLQKQISDTLASLRNRSLIEKAGQGFSLHPVIMEYTTDAFIDLVYAELCGGAEAIQLLNSYPLLVAQAKDYVREAQKNLILQPLLDKLVATSSKSDIERSLDEILKAARNEGSLFPGYLGGNIVNLLLCLGRNLDGYDLSDLTIRQAYLQGAELYDVDFTNSDLNGSVFTETFGNILGVTFNHSGDIAAACSANGSIYLWKTDTWELLVTCAAHESWVRSVSFNSDGSLLISSSDDRTVKLWSTKEGHCIRTFYGHDGWIKCAIFSPDEQTIASFSEDTTIKLWDIESGTCLQTLQGHKQAVNTGVFHPDGHMLVSGSSDKTLKLWDVKTGECLKSLDGHTDRVWAVALNQDTHILASGGEDQIVRLWDMKTMECDQNLQPFAKPREGITSLSFSPDGKTIVSGGYNSLLRLWYLNNKTHQKTLTGHTGRIRSVAFSPDGKSIISGGDDQTIRIWDIAAGQCIKVLRGYTNRIWSIRFSPKDTLLATGSDDGVVRLWEAQSGKCLKAFPGHHNWIWSLDFHPNSNYLASCGDDHMVRLWNVTTGKLLNTLYGHKRRVRSVAFNPKGTLLASGSEDHTVRLWNLRTGECRVLQEHTGRVHYVTFSPDGTTLATAGEDKSIKLWDVATGNCFRILQKHSNWVWSMAFSPDGQVLASAGDDATVILWNAQDGKYTRVLRGHEAGILSLAFNPTGTIMASGSQDGTIRLWRLPGYECLAVLSGHTNWVWSVSFNSTGQIMASSSEDATVRLWDMENLSCVRILKIKRPYENMNITNVTGLTEAQKDMLKDLGAIEILESV
jgi:WD40 repeat protein